MKRILLFIVLCSCASLSSAQDNNHLFISGNSTLQLDFAEDPPLITETGVGSFEAVSHVEDTNGNVQFWVNAEGAYDANGNLIDDSDLMVANTSSTELAVCPVPGEPDQYFLIYNAETCSDLYYSVLDLAMNEGQGGIALLNETLAAGTYAESLEVVGVPCGNSYRLLAFNCGEGIVSFEIGPDGFGEEELVYALVPEGNWDGRGELDYHNGRIGQAFAYSTTIFLGDYNVAENQISNPIELFQSWGCGGFDLDYTGGYGMGFSPDGSKAYIANWFTCNPIALMVYDFATGTSSFVEGYHNLGQIELGSDGKLYIASNYSWDYRYLVVENPNDDEIIVTEIPSVPLEENNTGLGISDVVYSAGVISAYLNPLDGCLGSEVGIELVGEASLDNWDVSWWLDGLPLGLEDLTDPGLYQVSAENTGEYFVDVVLEQGECVDTLSSSFTVLDVESGFLEEIYSCAADSLLLSLPDALEEISWSFTDETLPEVYVTETGAHTVSGMIGDCVYEETFEVSIDMAPSIALPDSVSFCGASTLTLVADTDGENYSWSTGDESLETVVTTPGQYTFTAMNGDCTSVVSVEAIDDGELVIENFICVGETDNNCDGFIGVSTQGGTAPITYSWSGPNGLESSEQNLFDICDGEYFLTVEDHFGCSLETSSDLYGCFTGIEEWELSLDIFPNPAQDILHIASTQRIDAAWYLIDAFGRRVLQGVVDGHSTSISLGMQARGMYTLILVEAGGQALATRLILQP